MWKRIAKLILFAGIGAVVYFLPNRYTLSLVVLGIIPLTITHRSEILFIIVPLIPIILRGQGLFLIYLLLLVTLKYVFIVFYLRYALNLRNRHNSVFAKYTKHLRTITHLRHQKSTLYQSLSEYHELYRLTQNLERVDGFNSLKKELRIWVITQRGIELLALNYVLFFRSIFQFQFARENASSAKSRTVERGNLKMQIITDKSEQFINMLFEILQLEIARIYRTEEIRKYSITDSLTNLYTQRHIKEILEKELKRALRYNSYLSVAMIDIDDFKKINDTHGHQTGDLVLKKLSELFLNSLFQGLQKVGRYGGEEFLFIFLDTNKKEAAKYVQKLLQDAKNMKINDVTLSFSAGIAEFPKDAFTAVELIEAADTALYEAKRTGKSKVVLY